VGSSEDPRAESVGGGASFWKGRDHFGGYGYLSEKRGVRSGLSMGTGSGDLRDFAYFLPVCAVSACDSAAVQAIGKLSGAKARGDYVGSMRGLKPPPPSVRGAFSGAKAQHHFGPFAARLKSCPDTKPVHATSSEWYTLSESEAA